MVVLDWLGSGREGRRGFDPSNQKKKKVSRYGRAVDPAPTVSCLAVLVLSFIEEIEFVCH